MLNRVVAAACAVVATFVPDVATGAGGRLSLEDALARAVESSPLVRRARLELGVVRAGRAGAGVLLPSNPIVAGEVGRRFDVSPSAPSANGLEGAVRLEQTIEIAGQRGARLAEVDAGIRAAIARVRLASIETRARVRVAYLSAQLAAAQLDSAKAREELGRRLYDSARARVQAGAASEVEVHLATVERGRITADRLEAQASLAERSTELERLLALPVGTPLELTTPLSVPPPVTTPDAELLARARERREELKALDEHRSQLDATVVRLRREIVPNPTLFLGYANQQPGQHYVGGGLAFPLPLWRRNQGELAQVRAEQALVDGERALVDREIQLELALARKVLAARRDEAELWARDVLPAAESAVTLVEQGWRAGKFDLFRVIQASREAGDARRRQLERLGALWQAAVELDRATGTP